MAEPHPSLPSAEDIALVAAGKHPRVWDVLGAHHSPGHGTAFSVWAPAARSIAVVGEWNDWSPDADPLDRCGESGLWAGVVESVEPGALYKLSIEDADGQLSFRADPMAQATEAGAGTASVVWSSSHRWADHDWMGRRDSLDPTRDRIATYEVHLGSWRRRADGTRLSYRELAPRLADHVLGLGFTHVELLPVAEHPYDPSWGYQVTGYYAPTARYGDPDDFRAFVDHLHQRGLGVIVDWVPAHFPKDEWALARFDGTPLYEHTDPRRAEHPDWGTLEFDLTDPFVRGFLSGNARYWIDELHVDGLRVDAVASMLYLDYSRDEGEWTPNEHGGNHDLDAVSFLQELNATVHAAHPGILTVAEESTAWDGVSRAVAEGGLGFSQKWNLGWMHDTLGYWSTPPVERPSVHDKLTFGLTYAYAEHFVLPLSHDEVVHLKKPLLGKMPGGTDEERFDHLRALYAWMWAHPGKPLLFMGAELGEEREWSQDRSLDWSLLDRPLHAGLSGLLVALNAAAVAHPALHRGDADESGFQWLEVDSPHDCTFAFLRRDPTTPTSRDVGTPAAERGRSGSRAGAAGTTPGAESGHPVPPVARASDVVCIANLSDVDRGDHRVGVPAPGDWRLVLSSADVRFGGSVDVGASSRWSAEPVPHGGQAQSIAIDLPARSVCYLVPEEP